MSSVFQPGHTAVVTGGASGIGLALVETCLARGMRVLAADRNAATLAALAASVDKAQSSSSSSKGHLVTLQMDVAQPADWAALRARVDADLGGRVHLLVLNAGVGGATPWTDTAAFHRILDVNLWGVIHGVATLLPVVQATAAAADAPPTAVVITGSKQGITNPPGTSPAYNASKAAVRALAEQLAFDLRDAHPNVAVHLLVPGWTFTGLSGNDPLKAGAADAPDKKEKPAGAWWPQQVVDYLLEAMAAKRFYVLCPDNDVTEAVDRKRILWSAGDVAEGRPGGPSTRRTWQRGWRKRSKEGAEKENKIYIYI
ncbi:short chain dehydrogenase reductase [Niveomyces insectorum RCEF 264]|uniref:Short chain dehydrogenase reductase n=1 Tax=Niveomyces insectorum RCEF 264 TaxID=1081102 RepID=A0A167ZTE4_9HYPO|nr:short chain dehydrogenase reductase [Niveomyces insectorum RCEF 264]